MKETFLSLLLLFPLGLAAQVRYNVVNLEASGTVQTYNSLAMGINDLGQIAGSFHGSDGSLNVFRHDDATGFVSLGNLGGGVLNGTGINNSGQIAAYGSTINGEGFQAVRHSTSLGFVSLGSLGGKETETGGINNRGQVTGFSELPNGMEHAFRYTDGVGMEDLGSLFGGGSSGYAINDQGWVTGSSDGLNVFLYRDDLGMTYLGPGRGYAINNLGVVAGENGIGFGLPVLFRNGQSEVLGDLGGSGGAAFGINEFNQVVGFSLNASRRYSAFLWTEADGMLDLNTLIDPNSGWTLGDALDINDAGQIVGEGLFDGKSLAYRLDPIPEPSTWALLGLGGLLSMFFHRRLKR